MLRMFLFFDCNGSQQVARFHSIVPDFLVHAVLYWVLPSFLVFSFYGRVWAGCVVWFRQVFRVFSFGNVRFSRHRDRFGWNVVGFIGFQQIETDP